ncbi:MAG: hypothetical protein WC645_07935 [Candidatus Margulisiibacteriota bacterium]
MIPEILKMAPPPKHAKGGSERRACHHEMQMAMKALDEAKEIAKTGRLPNGRFASLDARNMTEYFTDELTRSEIAYLKATVETVTRLVGENRKDIRRCRSRAERVELKAIVERQEAVIAAAKAELELRSEFRKVKIVSVEYCY